MDISIFTNSKDLPEMQYVNFFHSRKLMQTYERSSLHKPYMVVAAEGERVLAHMLVARRNGKCHIYGEGEYEEVFEEKQRSQIFGAMLEAFTKTMRFPTLYIEVSDISQKMFAYRHFRQNDYFPIHWLEVHNSLHSKSPQDRMSRDTLRKIAYARKMGVSSRLVTNQKDFHAFYNVIRAYYNFHLRKFCPKMNFFANLMNTSEAKLFITTFQGKTIGACAIVCNPHNAYLWFGAYKSKSHPRLHPDIYTIWSAMDYAWKAGIDHFNFMDVGLPFFHNSYYDLIMLFNGKSVGTNRWFRFFPSILNKIFRLFLH